MKKHVHKHRNANTKSVCKNLLLIFLFALSGKGISQTETLSPIPTAPQITPGGFFDVVYDQYGNPYQLANLSLTSTKPIGGTSTVSALPTVSCSSGYFTVYFASGSYWDNGTQNAQDARNALCQVLGDISNHISSPLSAQGNTVTINI